MGDNSRTSMPYWLRENLTDIKKGLLKVEAIAYLRRLHVKTTNEVFIGPKIAQAGKPACRHAALWDNMTDNR